MTHPHTEHTGQEAAGHLRSAPPPTHKAMLADPRGHRVGAAMTRPRIEPAAQVAADPMPSAPLPVALPLATWWRRSVPGSTGRTPQ